MVRRGCRVGHISADALTRQLPMFQKRGRAAAENPYIGDRHQLTVLVAYSDRSFEEDSVATLQQWDKIFNQEGFCESPYVGSVHDYFYDQSYGQFRLTFDLEYVALGKASRYASTASDDDNSQYLVNDIVDALLQRDINWSRYDWSGDGYVNQLLIVYAGKGMNEGASNAIWPHQWWLSQHTNPETKKKCEARTVSYAEQNYLVDRYCAVNELGGGSSSFGTLCHEYSHCFGLPDFYNGGTKYVGGWDLMDYGNYNGDGYVPCGYSAHERWFMGWITPEELTQSSVVSEMSALSDADKAYLIRNEGYANEYYIVENRQQKGWDAQLPGSGIVIFHIDYDEDVWTDPLGLPNSYSQQRYVIFHANNSSTYYKASGWAYPYIDNNELTNTSAPAAKLWNANTDGTYLMNKSITNMAVSDSLASFTFSPEPTAISEITYSSSATGVYYNLSGQRVAKPGKGIYILSGKKVMVK